MFEKAKPARDAFTFSLGGMTAITPFVAAPAIAADEIDRIRDERMKQPQIKRDRKPLLWFGNRRQPT